MKITHVIRGSEWLPSLPLHALICRAFGWQEPVWIHLSVFLKPSGKGKMSKRESADLLKDGYSIFIKDLQDLGYTPEAVVNWVALMGWSYDDHTEFFNLEDLVDKFNLEHLNPSPAAINFSKLDHFNGLHIRNLPDEELANRIAPFFERQNIAADKERLIQIAPILKERIATLDEAVPMAAFFFKEEVNFGAEELIPKGLAPEQVIQILQDSYHILSNLPKLTVDLAEPPMRAYVESSGFTASQVFGILRVAVTGQKISPPLFESMEIIGREKVLERITQARKLLE